MCCLGLGEGRDRGLVNAWHGRQAAELACFASRIALACSTLMLFVPFAGVGIVQVPVMGPKTCKHIDKIIARKQTFAREFLRNFREMFAIFS